jgi:hypothetical protein
LPPLCCWCVCVRDPPREAESVSVTLVTPPESGGEMGLGLTMGFLGKSEINADGAKRKVVVALTRERLYEEAALVTLSQSREREVGFWMIGYATAWGRDCCISSGEMGRSWLARSVVIAMVRPAMVMNSTV